MSRKPSDQISGASIQMFGVNLRGKNAQDGYRVKTASGPASTSEGFAAAAERDGLAGRAVVMANDAIYSNVPKEDGPTAVVDGNGKTAASSRRPAQSGQKKTTTQGHPAIAGGPEHDSYRISAVGGTFASLNVSKTKQLGLRDPGHAMNIYGSNNSSSQYQSIPVDGGNGQVPRFSQVYKGQVSLGPVNQRSQSVAENMRKRQLWKFQQPSGNNINRAPHDLYRDGGYSELEVRGLNQGANQRSTLLDHR